MLTKHDEGVALIGEQQSLVSHHHEIGIGTLLPSDDGIGRLQLIVRRTSAKPGRGSEHIPQAGRKQEQQGDQSDAQRPRGLGIECELPPQVVPIRDLLVGEEEQPANRHSDAADRQQPVRGEGLRQSRGAPVELAARHCETPYQESKHESFIEAAAPDKHQPEVAGKQQEGDPPGGVQPVEQAARDKKGAPGRQGSPGIAMPRGLAAAP